MTKSYNRYNLIQPAIYTFHKVVLEKDDQGIKSMLFSNNTVSSRIDEMSFYVEVQLVEKLKYTHFSIQLDESTIRDNEPLLMVYVRYVDNGEFLRICYFVKH